jgi:uncharacterized protein (TIGR03084 family)
MTQGASNALQVGVDLRDEVDEFSAFLETLEAADWERETAFMEWTPWDVVAHLHYFDHASLVALEGEEAFAPERRALFEAIRTGTTNKQLARKRFGDLDATRLIARWVQTAHALAQELSESDPKRRLPWFAPDMGVAMFTTARYMETWAHAQEVYDLVGASRLYTDRIKNIATIGVKTFGWTFANRKLDPPGQAPHVRLVAPSGDIWEWNNPPSENNYVRGEAVDFCHVVTQTRNVLDTPLDVTGPVATQWMSIAQCFAGTPADPPEAGSRSR